MNIKFCFLSMFICFSSIQALASANDSEFNGNSSTSAPRTVQQDIRELMTGIADVKRVVQERFSRCPADAKTVILLGPTGTGKSTLMHLLAGIPMISELDPNGMGYRVDTQNRRYLSEDSTIGHRNAAQTTIPSSWYDQSTNTVFWDCPGFEDPRGHNQKIINAYAIDQLFRGTSNVKLALLANEPDLESYRGAGFLKLLHEVTDTFPNHPDLKDNISVIMSKQQNATDIPLFLRNRILTIPQREQRHLTPVVRNLLTHLAVDHQKRIAYFPRPTAAGRYAPSMEDVRSAINEASFARRLNPVLRLSEDTNNYIDEAFNVLNSSIISYLRNQGNTHIINYCKNRIKTHKSNVIELRSHFTGLIDTLRNFRNTQINLQDPRSFTQKLGSVFGQDFDVSEINNTISLMEFLKNIRHSRFNGDPFNMLQWIDTLALDEAGYPIRYINELTKAPEISARNAAQLIFRGTIIGSSDIANELLKVAQANKPVNRIDVFALNTLFLDQDVQKLGCYINMIAPYWIGVNGERTINISGTPGLNGAHGAHGVGGHGQPGGPGGKGGNFYGKGKYIYSLDEDRERMPLGLIVNIDGGPGGRGGNGGNGAAGANGVNGNPAICTHIENPFNWEEIRAGRRGHRIVPFRGWAHYYQHPGTAGQPGQDGGDAGVGGIGGYNGFFSFDGVNADGEPLQASYPTQGAGGEDGIPGAGGPGGTHGVDCNLMEIKHVQCYSNHHYRRTEGRHHLPEGQWGWRNRRDRGMQTLEGHYAYAGQAENGSAGGYNTNGQQQPIAPEDNPAMRSEARRLYGEYVNGLTGPNYRHVRPFIERLNMEGPAERQRETAQTQSTAYRQSSRPSVSSTGIPATGRSEGFQRYTSTDRSTSSRAEPRSRPSTPTPKQSGSNVASSRESSQSGTAGATSSRAAPPSRPSASTAKQSGPSVASSRESSQSGIANLIRRFNQQ